MSFEIQQSLEDATPHSFKISKNDVNDPEKQLDGPEGYVSVIIRDWVYSITSPKIREKNPEAWEGYHNYFGATVVLGNDQFPSSLPIGYVIVCFLISCRPTIYRVKDVRDLFNGFIQFGNVRNNLFEFYKKGEFYFIDLSDSDSPDLSSMDIGESLYKQPESEQINLFND